MSLISQIYTRGRLVNDAAPVGAPVRSSSQRTNTGKVVDPEVALTVPAFLAGVTLIAGDIASLPLITYRRLKGGGKERATDFDLYPLLHDAPNPEHTAMQWRQLIMGHLICWGNHYSQIIINGAGRIVELWPLNPARMRVDRNKETNARQYHYQQQKGMRLESIDFTDAEILYIPGFGFDGLVGYSLVTLARNQIALALSTEEYGGTLFKNDSTPAFVLKAPGKLSPKAWEHLNLGWDDTHQGSGNAHHKAVLEEGLEIQQLGLSNEDSQFLETQKFTVSQLARILHIPPHMIGDVEKSTSWGTGIEQQELGYANHTLKPWTVTEEQALALKLLTKKEKPVYFFEHLFDGLLRGDITQRYQAYALAIQNGAMNPNEWREKENQNPYKGGETYRVQLNTTPSNNAQNLMPVMVDAAARCRRRESHDVLESARKFMKRNDAAGFASWLTGYYGADHIDFMVKQFAPIARVLCAMAEQSATDETLDGMVRGFAEPAAAVNALRVSRLAGLGLEAIEAEVRGWDGTAETLAAEAMLRMTGDASRTPAADMPEPGGAQSLTVNITNEMPEAAEQAAPVVNLTMQPTPVEITNDVHVAAAPRRQIQLIKDEDGNWRGQTEELKHG